MKYMSSLVMRPLASFQSSGIEWNFRSKPPAPVIVTAPSRMRRFLPILSSISTGARRPMLKLVAPSLPRFIQECQGYGVKAILFSDREVEFVFTAPAIYTGAQGSTPILLELKYVFVGMVPSIGWRERTKTRLFERLREAQLEVREGIWLSATETYAVPWRESDLDEGSLPLNGSGQLPGGMNRSTGPFQPPNAGK